MNFSITPDNQRSAFPVKYFNNPIFDTKVFNMASRMMHDYQGGYWEYVTTDRAAFLRLADKKDAIHILENPFSGEHVKMDATASGMILTSYALVREIENGKDLRDIHYRLNDALQDYLEEIDRFDIWMKLLD